VKKIFWFLIVTYAMLGLTACSDSPDSDIVEFVDKTKRKESKLQELPAFKKPVPYFYEGANKRDPFYGENLIKAKAAVVKNDLKANYTGPKPDLKRKKEALEEYALDELSMVGVISKNGKYWALIKDSSGIVHRVGLDNYLGQNYGRVVGINEVQLTVDELVPDGEGGWRERKGYIKMK
jgi:type IV pilus assembly protein PilP